MRKDLAVFALGLGSALAFAPYNFFWILFITFPLFLKLIEDTSGRRAFAQGWLFGFGFFLAGLFWVSAALFVDIAKFWWVLPFAAGGLPVGLALFVGAATWGAQHFKGLSRLIAFAVFFCALEWVRGHVLTGFPWQLIGYAWVDTPFLQLAAYGGAYGLSLWATLLTVLPTAFFTKGAKPFAPLLLIGLLLAGGYGAALLRPPVPVGEGPLVRIVQPNIAQSLKLDPAMRSRNFQKLLANTLQPGIPDIIIWPESAVPYTLGDPDTRHAIANILPPNGILLTGTVRVWDEGDTRHYANSLQALNKAGDLVGYYDKVHLVPFGEFVPLRGLIPFEAVAAGADFSVGPGPVTLHVPGVPAFSTRICYEAIFPGVAVDETDRPDWIVNITNDGWYGQTSGPYQHFEISRVRAVEEGLPLVRVANTGISGLVGADGRIMAQTALGEEAVLDVRLPKTLPPPPYALYGDIPFGLALLMGAMALFVRKRY